ncbi:MAG: response regulator transcription factor [candidate division KSB1 bacterium]|nr:response regulator transcription factor [candidate division KSB1 bacterium]
MRVFIADDSAIVRERLRAMLSELPEIEIVGEAQDPVEATSSIRALKPDAVILDIRMPGGSGIDVLQNIKQDKPAPMVIILTNYPYPQYQKKCRAAGADFFFDKSTEFDKITEVFKQFIRDSHI